MKFQILFSIIVLAILGAIAIATNEVMIAQDTTSASPSVVPQKNDPLSSLSVN